MLLNMTSCTMLRKLNAWLYRQPNLNWKTRLIRKTGVTAHDKPHTIIRRFLVTHKDKDHPQDKCGVVYQLTCHDCEASYIGETERAFRQRLKEHQKDSSPVGHHMEYNNHKVDTQNIRIVDRDSRWFQRGVREAIQIRSRSPTPQPSQRQVQHPLRLQHHRTVT